MATLKLGKEISLMTASMHKWLKEEMTVECSLINGASITAPPTCSKNHTGRAREHRTGAMLIYE